jgi:hypothetical protein
MHVLLSMHGSKSGIYACNAAQPGSQLKKEERSFPGMVPIV